MAGKQLDLFLENGPLPGSRPLKITSQRLEPGTLGDTELIARIPAAGAAEGPLLAMEAGRRGLSQAVPALEELCLRFAGFGRNRAIPEQDAALKALTMIAGQPAKQAVTKLIVKGVVEGPSLKAAVAAAAKLEATLPADTILGYLHHEDKVLCASACRCVPAHPEVISRLLELLHDCDHGVRTAAACALGRVGRKDALSDLTRLLQQAPSAEVIDAVAPIANEDCIILLGRIARMTPCLAEAAMDALCGMDHPRARQLVAKLNVETKQ